MAQKVTMLYGNPNKANTGGQGASGGGGGGSSNIVSATASANTLPEGSSATASASFDTTTQILSLVFGIPVGATGATGNGIASIAKTGTSGLTDTYTITYSDNTTSTFTVTNGATGPQGPKGDTGSTGAKGDKGDKGDTGSTGATGIGIASISKTGTSGLVDTYTITYTDGTTSAFTVTNGQTGAAGHGITSIVKTSTSGLVDTYTISYSDNTTSSFTVTNGQDGDDGEGVPSGGTTGDVLIKQSSTDFDAQWITPYTVPKPLANVNYDIDSILNDSYYYVDAANVSNVTARPSTSLALNSFVITKFVGESTYIQWWMYAQAGIPKVYVRRWFGAWSTWRYWNSYPDGVTPIPAGGTAGQVLAKRSGTDYDTEWVNQSGGGNTTVKYDESDDTIYLKRDGEWVAWQTGVLGVPLYLYKNGNVSDLTGGFSLAQVTSASVYNVTMTLEVSDILIATSSDTGWKRGALITNNAIDLTDYNSLKIEYSIEKSATAPTSSYMACIASGTPVNSSTIEDSVVLIGDTATNYSGVATIDISNFTGSHYVVPMRIYTSGTAAITAMRITKIWLEK